VPLEKGASKAVIRRNIKREIAAGRKPKEAVAIAYRKARETNPRLPRRKN